MPEIPITHQIEYLKKEITKNRRVISYTDDPVTISWLNDTLAMLEAILETVEESSAVKCSICGKPQRKENVFICISCIPFDDGK